MELNPNHPVTREASEVWHKVAALLTQRLGGSVVLTTDEITRLEGKAITIKFTDTEGIVLNIVSMEEGERLAKLEGGLPH